MLAASLLALQTNLPLVDLDGFLQGRRLASGQYRVPLYGASRPNGGFRLALVVDDSLLTGREMEKARARVEEAGLTERTLFGAVICHPARVNEIDFVFDVCAPPRVFEWNLMHGNVLPRSCVDIDGVLCVDPTDAENDDGPRYRQFVLNARPLHLPTARIGTLVTSRLEKYREATEHWMTRHGIVYDALVMMQYDTMAERQAAKAYASFKAEVYAASDAMLFVESSDPLAAQIARLSGKPALCVDTNLCYGPSGLPHARQRIRKALSEVDSLAVRLRRKAGRILRGSVPGILNPGRRSPET